MKAAFLSFAVGLAVGVLYGLIRVEEPCAAHYCFARTAWHGDWRAAWRIRRAARHPWTCHFHFSSRYVREYRSEACLELTQIPRNFFAASSCGISSYRISSGL